VYEGHGLSRAANAMRETALAAEVRFVGLIEKEVPQGLKPSSVMGSAARLNRLRKKAVPCLWFFKELIFRSFSDR
jgi:hypothetical protein